MRHQVPDDRMRFDKSLNRTEVGPAVLLLKQRACDRIRSGMASKSTGRDAKHASFSDCWGGGIMHRNIMQVGGTRFLIL